MCLTLLSALDISMSPMVSAWVSFSGGLSALRRGWWCETLESVMGVILSGVDFFAVSVTGLFGGVGECTYSIRDCG